MGGSAGGSTIWSLDGCVAQLDCGELAGKVDVERPDMGLRGAALDHDLAPCVLFCTRRGAETSSTKRSTTVRPSSPWPLAVAEAYVRGNDLVASYRPSEEWPYLPQLYWQAKTLESVEGTLSSISHLVSVQTHLLDTHPKIDVASQVPSSESFLVTVGENGEANVEPAKREGIVLPSGSTCCVVWRPLAARVSYIEIVSANDVCKIEFFSDPQGGLIAKWHLFAEFLEKGVIRRARVHAALLPRENDMELALECCKAAEQCPLALTT